MMGRCNCIYIEDRIYCTNKKKLAGMSFLKYLSSNNLCQKLDTGNCDFYCPISGPDTPPKGQGIKHKILKIIK